MSENGKKSLGEFLKSERERRGLTIEQTSSATKIGLKVLKQLEADQYASLPALPFVRGFVRNYGKFLGLDGEKLLAEYAEFLESHANERPKRDAGHSGYAFERPEGEQSRKILWGVMAGMLVFGGAVVFVFKPSLKHKHHGHIDKLKPGAAGVEPGESSNHEAIPSESPTSAPSVVPSAEPSGLPSPTPAPTHTPAPTPTHSPTHAALPEASFAPPKVPLVLAPPSPVESPSPTPAPSPSESLTPTPAATPIADDAADLKNDPLQSGRNYAPKEVRMKLILRTKADLWVRYRCDEKKLMKFALKKEKILVLRGKSAVFVQVSNPDSITIQATGEAEMPFSAHPNVFDFHGTSTLVFPAQATEKIEESFKVGAPLPHTDAPVPGA